MVNYSGVSIIALLGYLFLLLAFLAAKKTKVVKSFIAVLVTMLLCTGGSFLMRIQFWPSVYLWHHVSLLGILLIPCVFFKFFLCFLEEKRNYGNKLFSAFFLIMFVVNLFTNVFIPLPEIVEGADGKTQFLYHYSYTVCLLLGVAVIILIQCIRLFIRCSRGDELIKRQLKPVLLGIGILTVGTVMSTFPFLRGIPTDIIGSIVFVYLLFYALYKKHLFKLTLLFSPANCYIVAVLISMAALYRFVTPTRNYLMEKVRLSEALAILAVAMLMLVIIFLLYIIMKNFINTIFVREEHVQAETLKQFSYSVSKTLDREIILSELMEVLSGVIGVTKAYVCIKDSNGQYNMEKAMSPLEDLFVLKSDHPLIEYMAKTDGCVLIEDFKCSSNYRSMWEIEKLQLDSKGIQCMVPMKDNDELIGIILLAKKNKNKQYTYDDFGMLSSVSSVCSMAVKNSSLYEKAYEEARKDELTGLYNRKCFYEKITSAFENSRDKSLALIMLNVDDFKLYNQLYGNKEGDYALKRIAEIINASVGGQGDAFRMGGKEFTIILPGFDIYSAKLLAESIAQQVRDMNSTTKMYRLKTLTMSCGICASPYLASSVDELISNADLCVYNAKRAGKNKVVMYNESIEHSESNGSGAFKSAYDEYKSTIYALTAAIDAKDHYTFGHSQNVAYYASELAKACGMSHEFIGIINEAGMLHDIGKIGITDNILNKPGKLDAQEYETMKTHVENSVGIIRHLPSLDYVIPAVISHHERYDGCGYPRGIAGEDIPLMGRMLCVVDSFDAMISRRTYKKAMSVEKALQIVEEEKGRQFDPKLADLFIEQVRNGGIQVRRNDSETEAV